MAFYKTSLFDEIWSKSLTKTNALGKPPLSIPTHLDTDMILLPPLLQIRKLHKVNCFKTAK